MRSPRYERSEELLGGRAQQKKKTLVFGFCGGGFYVVAMPTIVT